MSSQAILIGLAASATADIAAFIPLAVVGLFLIVEWRDICQPRALDVSYAQALIAITESDDAALVGERVMTDFKRWQKQPVKNKRVLLDCWNALTLQERQHALQGEFSKIARSLDPDSEEMRDKAILEKSKTRFTMDHVIPGIFAALWMVQATVAITRLS